MAPDCVLVFPREAKLKIMAGSSFVDGDGPRIHRGRAPEVAKFFRRLGHVTNAIFIQSRRRSEIILLSKSKRAQVFGCWPKSVMLDPLRHGENAPFFEKFADLKFSFSRIFDPRINLRCDL